MLKKLFNAIGVRQNSDKAHYYSSTNSRIIPSVFHTIILPIGIGAGSALGGAIYFLFAVTAYFTVFKNKCEYFTLIRKPNPFISSLVS
jgi:hypothetical protein